MVIQIIIFLIILYCLGLYYQNNTRKSYKQPIRKTNLRPSQALKIDVLQIQDVNNGIQPPKKIKKYEKMVFEPEDIRHYNRLQNINTYADINTYNKTTPTIHDNYNELDIEEQLNILHMMEMDRANEAREFLRNIEGQNPDFINNAFVNNANSQNVHDTNICNTIRNIYSNTKILNSTEFNVGTLIDEIIAYAQKNKPEKVETITKVLNDVRDRNSRITNVNNATELELLATVWNEANIKESKESEQNIKDMLIIQIEDTYSINISNKDKGFTLCPTGFVNRIATALVVENPDAQPKTKQQLTTEIMDTAAKLRDDLEKDTAYTVLDDDAQSAFFKKKLLEKLNVDYLNILTSEEIIDVTKDWIDLI